MPDRILRHQAERKKKFDPVRASRILQLSREWNVPTQNILSTVYWGSDDAMEIPDRTDYYTFDKTGAIQYRKIDYAPVKGWAAGTYSKAAPPPPDVNPEEVMPGMKPIGPVNSAMPADPTQTPQQTASPTGLRKKAKYGDILPIRNNRKISSDLENVPVNPLPVKDMSIANYFAAPSSRELIPTDASLNGPSQLYPQTFIHGQTGELYQDNGDGPIPISSAQKGSSPATSSMSLNAGSMITGFNAALNQMYDHSQGIKEFSRLKRKQLQDSGYNPFAYGTGSSAIYRNGGAIAPVGSSLDSDGQIYQFNGPSHEQGGIPIQYGNNQVEVEGGETAYKDRRGNLNIFGNLKIPGSNSTFKSAGRKLGKLEDSLTKKLVNAQAIMSENDPDDKYQALTYNSANLSAKAISEKLSGVNSLKEKLSLLQERALTNNAHSALKARDGIQLQEDPKKKLKPSLAVRHNNPGNIKYADWLAKKYGATKGERSTDGDNFARFPDTETGLKAMAGLLKGPGYKKLSVEKALQRWSHSPGYKLDLGDLKDKVVGKLSDDDIKRVMNIITQGEDSRLYDLDTLQSIRRDQPNIELSVKPPTIPLKPMNYPDSPGTLTNTPPDTNHPGTPTTKKPYLPGIDVPPPTKKVHSNPLAFSQVAPEILALGDRPDFVPGQRYEPNLYQPYQVSFQDRLNENSASFNRIAAQTGNNPAAISVLAGQKYMADSAVLADEFRTNQGISNDITNKNISLLNDAQLKNLQLADTQFVRQTQAVANTRQNIYNAINSISSKIGQNRFESKAYNAYSNMFPQYDFDKEGNIYYLPNEAMSFGQNPDGGGDSYYQRQREEYDGNGRLKKKTVVTPSEAEQTKLEYQNWINQLKKRASTINQVKRANINTIG